MIDHYADTGSWLVGGFGPDLLQRESLSVEGGASFNYLYADFFMQGEPAAGEALRYFT